MSFSPGKRLEFERDMLAGQTPLYIRRAQPAPGVRALKIAAVVVLLAGVVGIATTFLTGAGFFSGEKRSIERMARTFVDGLAQGDGGAALDACAESTRGAQLVQAVERDVFGENSPETTANAEQQTAALRALHTELERAGVKWSDAKPIAFGGVRARIESDGMKSALTVLTGNIYFKSAQRIFAVEVSAWRCDGEHIILDVWKGMPVDAGEGELAKHAEQQFANPQGEVGSTPKVDVSFTKQVYVAF